MASAELDDLALRARSAYERGRRWTALRRAAPLALLPASAGLWCAPPAVAIGAALILLAGAAAFFWRGEGYGRAVLPGMLAGAPALALPVVVRAGMEHFCRSGHCWSLCLPFCMGAGVVAGAVLWRFAPHAGPDRARFLMAGTAVAAVTALPACSLFGLLGVGALLLGLVGSTAPALAPLRR